MLASRIHKSNLHILGLAETHLVDQSVVDIEGYTWFGHNRKHIHVRARTGSRGVGVLVRNDVLVNYNVDKVSDSVDGILWIRFSKKNNPDSSFYTCVVYLPPENSARSVNIYEFLDSLSSDIYTIPNGSPFYLFGDWNSRVSDMPDFIEGIDILPERNVVDFTNNSYGDIFYFEVIRAQSLVNSTFTTGEYDPKHIPDHSLICWTFNTLVYDDQIMVRHAQSTDNETTEHVKFDTRNVPNDWLTDVEVVSKLNQLILDLEHSENNQLEIDNKYDELVNVIQDEMNSKLDKRKRTSSDVNPEQKYMIDEVVQTPEEDIFASIPDVIESLRSMKRLEDFKSTLILL
ncbi:unnamed protein product [Mytilus coruscus]|uniref:Endonuclease/exonuclease/phosphatase domain-containing protein n=1 Tax=Mytilus coruscus TaxID=42192 RepID=A0A6J8E3I4_MYTCO|nr:unnamed protein product [Mytilus coruscus]